MTCVRKGSVGPDASLQRVPRLPPTGSLHPFHRHHEHPVIRVFIFYMQHCTCAWEHNGRNEAGSGRPAFPQDGAEFRSCPAASSCVVSAQHTAQWKAQSSQAKGHYGPRPDGGQPCGPTMTDAQ